ncbi:hypothetical protein BgiMline_022803 [Biomphalaria glabrata]|uniref:Uncharacterized protein LOC106067328 n=1 Tax=Biomphalaria glabrata TaxID=6526 RepID=A0A9U8ECG9_BIOGL|nr:uncharacterized protein LOC106067328 [Biomphalaria glabrata]XP_013081954.2 uncharacterized protein LOC106067328 [Biomphalaria glabrata]XP_013081955.2 uncharacterized protein LOC106067328 [Biomphalaria glabrata]KAI8757109.1 hypothetical protein BgiMline_010624 [Biomphalaria glabrata]
MSVSVAQHPVALGGSFSNRQVGVEYLSTLSHTDTLSAALYSRDHSSPVDSSAYPCGNSNQSDKLKESSSGVCRVPSLATQDTNITVDKADFNLNSISSNGSTFKTVTSEIMSSENNDPKLNMIQNQRESSTSDMPSDTGLFVDQDPSREKFDLESFMRHFPKSRMSIPESKPVPELTSRLDDTSIAKPTTTTNNYHKPMFDPIPRASLNTPPSNDVNPETAQDPCTSPKKDDSVSEENTESTNYEDAENVQFNSLLATRLKSSIQSEFLSKELFSDSKAQAPERTIDDIMRDYGIKVSGGAQTYKSGQFMSSMSVNSNVSGNNENAKSMSYGLDSFGSSRLGSGLNPTQPEMGTPYQLGNAQFSKELAKNLTQDTSVTGLNPNSMNCSQNNETEGSPKEEQKSFGTSVDLSMASKYQNTARTSSTYNTGAEKQGPFSGDVSYQTSTDYKKFDSHLTQSTTNFAGKYSSTDFGKQTDLLRTDDKVTAGINSELSASYSPGRGSNFRHYNQLGAADALGFSIQAEKQRLRNIDAMIATTPLNTRYNDLKPYKFSTSSSFVASDFDSRKRYSTPTLAVSSTLPYRAEINSRVGWSTGVTQNAMGKSVSAPNYEYSRNVTTTGSSVDSQLFNTSRDYSGSKNYQYNNCTYLDNNILDKKLTIKDSAPILKKKVESCLKPSMKMNTSNVGRGSPTRTAVTRPTSATNVKVCKDSAAAKRKQIGIASAPRGCVNGRKKVNTNESRMSEDFFHEFDFIKDLNRMWQHSINNLEPKKITKPSKYQPYKPASTEEKIQERSGMSAEQTSFHRAPEMVKNAWSASFEQDLGAALGSWGNGSICRQAKTMPSKQNCASGTKSFTAANCNNQQPKSILKNMSNKSSLTRSSTTITSGKSSSKVTTTSSRNYPITTAQMFAGLAIKKKAQMSQPAKPKNTKTRSKTPLI